MKGIVVQLAESTEDPQRYINDDSWAIEQKLDGDRVIVKVLDGKVRAFNRQGVAKTYWPDNITKTLSNLPGSWMFDGEMVGKVYWIFDIMEIPGMGDILHLPWVERRKILDQLFATAPNLPDNLRTTPWESTRERKQELFDRCIAEQVEGVMFKRIAAEYKGVRTNNWIKFKLHKTCDCVVMETDRKGKVESMGIGVYKNGTLTEVAGCRLLPAYVGRINVGDVVETRYLYATADDRLYQPHFQKIRTDKRPDECTIDQLIYTNRNIIVLAPQGAK